MRHAIILAHPRKDSFTARMAATYAAAAESLGHAVDLRDLYAMDFDPCLQADELPGPHAPTPRPDVVAERDRLASADVFALVYPFWFNAPPAILKGYVERVLGHGFGFDSGPGGTTPRLDGRRLISLTASGAPRAWVAQTGALDGLVTGFDRYLCAMTGLRFVDHLHFGDITPGLRPDVVQTTLDAVRRSVAAAFADPPPGLP